MVSDAAEGLSKWKSVFVLPHSGITQKIPAGALVLYQVIMSYIVLAIGLFKLILCLNTYRILWRKELNLKF